MIFETDSRLLCRPSLWKLEIQQK